MRSTLNIFLLFLVALAVIGCAPIKNNNDTLRFILKAPDTAKNGAVVPVAIQLPEPLSSTQTLKIFVNDQLGSTLTASNGAPVTYYASRYRMKKSGIIKAIIEEQGKLIYGVQKPVEIIKYDDAVKDIGPNGTKHKQRIQDKKIKLIFVNYMKSKNYLKRVTVHTDKGDVIFQPTLIMAAPPYLSINFTGNANNVTIDAKLGN